MLKRILILSVVVPLFLFLGTSLADDPMNPTQFTHKVRKESYKCYPNLKLKVSIARVHDNKLVKTPFGKEVGGTTIQGMKSSSPKVMEGPVRYDTRQDELGYRKGVRELLIYHLSSVKFLQLIEREEINAIIREWDFGDSKYVKKENRTPAIDLPEYIAKAVIMPNDGSCDNENDEAEAWGDKKEVTLKDELSKDKNLVLLRLYNLRTANVKLMACGTGNSVSETIKAAVKDLKMHRDLLFPTIRVTTVRNNRIELDGGSKQGLSPGTKFYLVKSDGPKEAFENFDDLEYVALCRVAQASSENATAVVTKRFLDWNPEIGDMVFYYFPEESW